MNVWKQLGANYIHNQLVTVKIRDKPFYLVHFIGSAAILLFCLLFVLRLSQLLVNRVQHNAGNIIRAVRHGKRAGIFCPRKALFAR